MLSMKIEQIQQRQVPKRLLLIAKMTENLRSLSLYLLQIRKVKKKPQTAMMKKIAQIDIFL